MHPDQQMYGRASAAALGGLAVQIVLAVTLAVAGLAAGSAPLNTAALYMIGGLPVWIVLALIYHQHRLERAEALEAEQLARADANTAALFNEHGVDLQIAKRRLNNLYKWGLGVTNFLVAFYLLGIGILRYVYAQRSLTGLRLADDAFDARAASPAIFMVIGLVVAFIAFVVARYEAGMTKVSAWQLLRGGATYLMGSFIMALLIGLGMGFWLFENKAALSYLSLFLPLMMIVLGVEILLVYLMSMYRPRKPGEIPRPAFDSRILGLLTSPQSLARALTTAINYQFGFEVSRSWFYQLLSRAITPLIVVGILVLVAMSSIVIVRPHEEAIVTRYGRMSAFNAQAGQIPYPPGLHLKWPWPVERYKTYEVQRIRQLAVGSSRGIKEDVAILWTNPHTEDAREEYLVAAPTPLAAQNALSIGEPTSRPADQAQERTPGVTLVGGLVFVQYRIGDLVKYLTSAGDPDHYLWLIAEREATRYVTTKDIDTLIGPGIIGAGDQLRQSIQAQADTWQLGLEVLQVSLAGVHPPRESNVAAAFHNQIGVLQERQTAIEMARTQEIATLGLVAGSRGKAIELNNAVQQLRIREDQLNVLDEQRKLGLATPQALEAKKAQVTQLEADVERLLTSARGQAAQIIHEARVYHWQRALGERAKAQRFGTELAAYRQAPELYRSRKYLEVLAQGMRNPRKVVILSQNVQAPPVLRLNLENEGAFDFGVTRK